MSPDYQLDQLAKTLSVPQVALLRTLRRARGGYCRATRRDNCLSSCWAMWRRGLVETGGPAATSADAFARADTLYVRLTDLGERLRVHVQAAAR